MSKTSSLPFYKNFDAKQFIKWTVYLLLLVNWGFYIAEEWDTASHTLAQDASLLDWASTFGTSIDLLAWFGLLFLWEMETYALSEEADTAVLRWTFLGIRGLCYVFIAHTVFSRAVTVNDLRYVEAAPAISSLCQLADQDISFAYNVHYTVIDGENCTTLSEDNTFFFIEDTAVTDQDGLEVERLSTFIDLEDAITWLLVMFTIEIAIWLQERNITGGPVMLASRLGKLLYGVLLANAAYWFYLGHWLYSWDQLLWIGGFAAIEMNVSDWRKDILHHYNRLSDIATNGLSHSSPGKAPP